MTVLLALRRIGPYHHARFQAAAARLALVVLETRPASQEYPWEFTPAGGGYRVERLRGAAGPEVDPPRACLDAQLAALLQQHQPAVVVTVGWADGAYRRLLLAAQARHVPLVIVSDSRRADRPRPWWLEHPKRCLLQSYSAALVAGRESRAYLHDLGFPAAAIHQPWDVVDNGLFAAAAADPPAQPPRLLCVARFLPRKNHRLLLQAYGAYQAAGGRWGLQLVGDGPEEPQLRRTIAALPDPDRVTLLRFQQLDDLRRLYGAASGFVLPSRVDQWGLVVNEAMAAGLPVLVSRGAGCAVDLIEEGRTGWTFDPGDPAALTRLLHRLEAFPAASRDRLRQAAAEWLRGFDPEAFATGLEAAVATALAHPRRSRLGALVARLR
jgi:glycosyltransferase involved in cell wall biosynthesis